MKRKILAILITVVMLVSILPTTGLAALTYAAATNAAVTFDGYVKNTTTAQTDKNNSTINAVDGSYPSSGIRVGGAGAAADFEPVTGMFGKAADDTSLKMTRKTSSTEEAYVGPVAKQTNYGCPDEGDFINMNWEWAFGDMNVERYVNAKFYNTGHSSSDVNSFSYDSTGKNIADILRISPNGQVRFFGKVLNKLYHFELNTWYNFDIRIKVGKNTDTENSIVGTKATAYLYVDGILIAEKQINNNADDNTTINNPHCIYRIELGSKAVKYADASVANTEVTYVDDIYAGKYRSNANNIAYRYMRDYTLSSKTNKFYTDGLHLALKTPMTAAQLKADLNANSNIYAIEVVNANREVLADDANVTPGCYIRVQTKSSGQWHYWYRKIVDNIYYINNSFEGADASVTPGSMFRFEKGTHSNTMNYAMARKNNKNGVNQAYMLDKNGSYYEGALEGFSRMYYDGTIDADKYVVEISLLRDAQTADYGPLKFAVAGQTVVNISNNQITLQDDNKDWPSVIEKDGRIDNRWIKVAIEVDDVEKSAKIYVNGDYTGCTRTRWDGENWYSNLSVITDNKGKLTTAFGKSYFDDIKVYSGTYNAGFDVASTNSNIVADQNNIFYVQGNLTAEELISATGANAIYTYENGEFGAEITTGALPANAVAMFTRENTDIVKYYDIVYVSEIGDITFDTSVAGKITANVVINNKSDIGMYKDAKLIIASYSNFGVGKELIAVDLHENNNLAVGENVLTATIDYDATKEIVAYIWKANNNPYMGAVPYIK